MVRVCDASVQRSTMAENNAATLAKEMSAEADRAGLRYSSDTKPGITRRLVGKQFHYFYKGRAVRKTAELKRIARLAIPPAWTDVWICALADGHLQATGRDARHRKQYRYHSEWRMQRDTNKYEHMTEFATALPVIRRRVRHDLALPGMPREKVLATMIRLMEMTLIRVGNEEYARDNGSYGLSTLKNHHTKVKGEKVAFHFRGKSGRMHEISIYDRTLAKMVRKCQHMPGQDLFGYEDDAGKVHDVKSEDVNEYLREITQADITAKDFRTWAGTVLTAIALRELEAASGITQAKSNISAAIGAVSKALGNTPAVCRKCYIHPCVVESYLAGEIIETPRVAVKTRHGVRLRLKPDEMAVLALLERARRRHRKA
jgi:DNA topoisomerase-1